MTDVDALLAKAKPRSEPFRLLLDMGDAAVEGYNDLVDKLSALPDDDTSSAERKRLAKALAKANEALRANELTGTLRALPLLAWEAAKGEHPPRDGHEIDMLLGVNALELPAVVRACIAEPTLTDGQFARLQEVVPAGEWRRLFDQVVGLNERSVSVPNLPSGLAAAS